MRRASIRPSRRTASLSVFAVEPRLDRLPVAAPKAHSVSAAEKTVLPMPVSVPVTHDAGCHNHHSSAIGDLQAFQHMPIAGLSTFSVIAILSRAVPSGTVGGRIARMSKPSVRRRAAILTARALSPIITGRI